MLYAHPRVDPDPARIRFVGFGDYSLDLDVFAYVTATDYGEYLEIAEDLNLRTMDIIAAAGTSLAVPAQTTLVETGQGTNRESASEISATVDKWRRQKELYLPGFPSEKISELRSSLDYPPEGSPMAG
jgi:MscS family membrane protein